jgi:hypothetical protein
LKVKMSTVGLTEEWVLAAAPVVVVAVLEVGERHALSLVVYAEEDVVWKEDVVTAVGCRLCCTRLERTVRSLSRHLRRSVTLLESEDDGAAVGLTEEWAHAAVVVVGANEEHKHNDNTVSGYRNVTGPRKGRLVSGCGFI